MTPPPTYIFHSGFENGLEGFDEYVAQQGAKLEVVEDPTGSGRGKVLKGTIVGSAVDQGAYLAQRAHPGKSMPQQVFPCRVQEDIWMSSQVYRDVTEEGSNWYSQLSLFERVGEDGRVFVTTSIMKESSWTGYDKGLARHVTLNIQDPDNDVQQFQRILPGIPEFTPEEWHTMAVEVDSTGMAYLFQDGRLTAQGELVRFPENVLGYAHGGPIYGGPSLSEGGYVLVDNFSITCWP